MERALGMTGHRDARGVGRGCQRRRVIRTPFVAVEAVASGILSERGVRRDYVALYPGVYVPRSPAPTAAIRAEAAWLWSKRRGVLAGRSAAALLGTKWVDGHHPAELIHVNRKAPPLLTVREETLASGETCRVRGMTVTTPTRTAFDVGRHAPTRDEAVQRLDALARATGFRAADVHELAARHRGVRGLAQLRAALPLVDGGAESPQETLARLALVDAGLPAPETQVNVYDRRRNFVARLDMAYRDLQVGIEYDGPQHWEDPAIRQRDIDKTYAFAALDWLVIRVSRDLLRNARPRMSRGCGSPWPDATRAWPEWESDDALGPESVARFPLGRLAKAPGRRRRRVRPRGSATTISLGP